MERACTSNEHSKSAFCRDNCLPSIVDTESQVMDELRLLSIRAFRAAVAAVQPYERVRESLRLVNDVLTVGKRSYKLERNLHMAAIGKAALGMVRGAESVLHGHIVDGIASVPRRTIRNIPPEAHLKTQFFEGATDNLPDEDACRNADRIEYMARRLTADDIFLVLLSGGGSALLPAPIYSISLDEKLATIKAMTSRGADIKQLNTVRKALSRLKGGKLAEVAHPAKVVSLIVSDIVGDPVELIASGPTVPHHESLMEWQDPVKILKQLEAWPKVPASVQLALHKHVPTPDKGEKVDVNNIIITNNETAISGISKYLEEFGYLCHTVSTTVAEDAQAYGRKLAYIVSSMLTGKTASYSLKTSEISTANANCADADNIVLLFGGECTVTLKGKGKGGRNQEIVLSALSKLLEESSRTLLGDFAILSAGTDGQDGPTDAAGAVLTSDDLKFVKNNGRWEKSDVDVFLNKNDSFNFWKVFRDGACHINTGPTGTNVMDVQILIIKKRYDIFTL